LFSSFVDYLLQSSAAMDATARGLASDSMHSFQLFLLKDSIDSAKVLLSQVIPPFILIFSRFPLQSILKESLERI
jgi:hypothetical protein